MIQLGRIVVVQHGRLRDKHIEALCADYTTRLRRYCTQFTRIETEKLPLWPSSARWKVLLDERGDALTSTAFAKRLADWCMRHGEVCFALGSADGHVESTRAAADVKLSLGPLTLPHQLAHLLLVEQVYRAATILAGSPYHRE